MSNGNLFVTECLEFEVMFIIDFGLNSIFKHFKYPRLQNSSTVTMSISKCVYLHRSSAVSSDYQNPNFGAFYAECCYNEVRAFDNR